MSACHGKQSENIGSNRYKALIFPIEKKTLWPYKYYLSDLNIIFYDNDEAPTIDSWTGLKRSKRYFTLINLSETNFSLDFLYRVVAHELAMMADIRHYTVDQVFMHREGLTVEDVCREASVLLLPEVRLNFSVIRAYQIEQSILQELFGSSERGSRAVTSLVDELRLEKFLKMDCYDRYKMATQWNANLIESLAFERKSVEESVTSVCGSSVPTSEEMIEAALKRQGNDEESVCQVLSKPIIGIPNISGYPRLLNPGPRCRVGGGCG